MVQEAAVALVSAAAETCQDEDFGRYYDAVMPFLMQVRAPQKEGTAPTPLFLKNVEE